MSVDAELQIYQNHCASLRAALAEAERERVAALRKLDDYLRDYKAFHGICTMRDLRDRAERAEDALAKKSTQIAELQEQLHHLYGVEQRAERAEADRTRALADLMVANMDRVKLEAALAEAEDRNIASSMGKDSPF